MTSHQSASQPGDQAHQTQAPTSPSLRRATPLVDSAELLRGARMIEIAHEGTVYRLQATRLGKLILTK